MTKDKNNLPKTEQVDVQQTSTPAEVVSVGEALEVPTLPTKERVSRFLRSQQGYGLR